MLDHCREDLKNNGEDNIKLRSLAGSLEHEKDNLNHELNKVCHEIGCVKKDLADQKAINCQLGDEIDHLDNYNKQYQFKLCFLKSTGKIIIN